MASVEVMMSHLSTPALVSGAMKLSPPCLRSKGDSQVIV